MTLATLAKRCQAVELILSDVDGVLTDGSIIFDNDGIETKRFHIHDGLGIKLWQAAGGAFGVVTARNSHIVNLRAAELGVKIVRQGAEQKLAAIRDIAAELRVQLEQVCYIGDDLPDLAAVQQVGLGVAVADACAELRGAAHYVTTTAGGRGAVRETVELVLKSQQRWDDLIRKYGA
jgi:YrbI family 3-deoxy-D-manno-octulosonate 8-phosphate phosphatase